MLDLTPIIERLDKATPGPWRLKGPKKYGIYLNYYIGKDNSYVNPRNRLNGFDVIGHVSVSQTDRQAQEIANGELFANCPTDLRAMIAEIERLRAIEKRFMQVVDSEINYWSSMDIEALDPDCALEHWKDLKQEIDDET